MSKYKCILTATTGTTSTIIALMTSGRGEGRGKPYRQSTREKREDGVHLHKLTLKPSSQLLWYDIKAFPFPRKEFKTYFTMTQPERVELIPNQITGIRRNYNFNSMQIYKIF